MLIAMVTTETTRTEGVAAEPAKALGGGLARE
jgi:hypothetical protein